MKTLVTGAGGFIGGHLVRRLVASGADVRSVDCKPFSEWHQLSGQAENLSLDLSLKENCDLATEGAEQVISLACNMGGIGFIEKNRLDCMLSVLINAHLIQSSIRRGVGKYFFSSTACVYNTLRQNTTQVVALREEDAYPAMPEAGYGWEKLFTENLCLEAARQTGMEVRVARLHNVYGPHGAWSGGREKAPAAICRKVALAKLGMRDEIEIWGDGSQMRSFMYVDDCVDGICKIMDSDIDEPINLGSSEVVSINQLVDLVEEIAEVKLRRSYDLTAPLGVVGRNSDNTKILENLGWEPKTKLKDGLINTYDWIYKQCLSLC